MPSQAVLTACSILLATAVIFPLERRYKAWKATRPELTLKRDSRGRLVPDLTVKRAERAVIIAITALVVFGLAVGFTIMAP